VSICRADLCWQFRNAGAGPGHDFQEILTNQQNARAGWMRVIMPLSLSDRTSRPDNFFEQLAEIWGGRAARDGGADPAARASALWIAVALVIIASHMAIPHKEYRFVFPVFACLALVVAVLPQGPERGILTFKIGC
jgi:hypothetical protein